jgi:hypothetical protein
MLADGTAVRSPLGAHMTVAAMSSGATSGKKGVVFDKGIS